MKKVILPLIAAACTLFANAIPTTFNYQGVVDQKNADVDVVFELVNGEEVIYTQKTQVLTNADGAFTAVIGDAEDAAWLDINWTADANYKLVTKIGDTEVHCLLQAVPFANVAAHYVGQEYIENDVQDLVEGMRNKADVVDLNELGESFEGWSKDIEETLMESFGATYEAIDSINTNVAANAAAIVAVNASIEAITNENDGMLTTLQNAIVENEAAIVAVNASIEAITNQEDGMLTVLQNAVAGIQEDAEFAVDGVQSLTEAMRGKASVEEVEAVKENVDAINEQIKEIVDIEGDGLGAWTAEQIGALEERIDLLYSEEDGPVANNTAMLQSLNNLVSDQAEEIDAIKEDAAFAVDGVHSLTEAMRGKASVEEVEAVKENVDAINEQIKEIVDIEGDGLGAWTAEQIGALEERIDLLYSEEDGPVANNTAMLQSLNNLVNDLTETVDQITELVSEDGALGTLQQGFTQLNNVVLDQEKAIGANEAAIAKNATDIVAINASIEAITNMEDGMLTVLSNQLAEVADDAAFAVDGVQALQTKIQNKADVADVTKLQDEVENISGMLDEIAGFNNPDSMLNALQAQIAQIAAALAAAGIEVE